MKTTAHAVVFFCTGAWRRSLAALTAAAVVLSMPGLTYAFVPTADLTAFPTAFQAPAPASARAAARDAVRILSGLVRISRNNLTALMDANGHVTTFDYDANGRLLKETRPLGQATVYTYDDAGDLETKTDAKGQKTKYGYDLAGRLTGIQFFTATDLNTPVKTVAFTYDAAGYLTGYGDGVTSSSCTYDALGRKTAETINYGTFSLALAYAYDLTGKKTSVTYPDGTTYAFAYDQGNRLSSTQIPGQGAITYSYQWNRPSQIIYPGGVRKTIQYDPFMRTSTITVTDPGQNILMQYAYGYDGADNVLSRTTEQGSTSFTYDPTNQLTASLFSPTGQAAKLEVFQHDAVGNRVSHLQDLLTTTATFSANNESETSGQGTYEHDSNGNLIRKTENGVTTTYVYDIQDRLVRVTDTAGLNAAYGYDAFGHRLWKEVNGVRTYFAYGEEGLIAETDAAGRITKTYGYQPDGLWGTDPVWMNVKASTSSMETTGYHWFHTDVLGTPMKMTTPSGAVTWAATYSPYGEAAIDASNSTVTNNLRFPGQYFDGETSFHDNLSRIFDPKTGRYITTDPIGFWGGDDDLYRYGRGNPNRYYDPTGRSIVWVLPWEELPALGPYALPVGAGIAAIYLGYRTYDWWKHRNDSLTFATEEVEKSKEGKSCPVAQPNPEGQVIVAPNGTAVNIPPGYVAEPTRNGQGVVYRPQGSTGDADTVRVMNPNTRNPGGYMRVYNNHGQPINPDTGRPDSDDRTHIPLK